MSGLTTVQAAALCEVSPATVRSWIKRGKVRRDRRGLLDQAELLAWWDKRDGRMVEVAKGQPQQQ